MNNIPSPEEIGIGHYFLQAINTTLYLNIFRILFLTIAVGFIGSYIYIRLKKNKEK